MGGVSDPHQEFFKDGSWIWDADNSIWIKVTGSEGRMEVSVVAEPHVETHYEDGDDEADVALLGSGADAPATDGFVATADGAGGVDWEAVPAGAGKLAVVLPAHAATFGVEEYAVLYKVDGDERVWYEVRFDADADEHIGFQFAVPAWFPGGDVKFTIYWKAAATVGDVMWMVNIADIDVGEALDVVGTDYAFAADTAQGTTERLNEAILTGQSSVFAAGDMVSVGIKRDADHASDTMAGDAKFLCLVIEEE